MRKFGTTKSGGTFYVADVLLVWAKGTRILGMDSGEWRLDRCGALIQYSKYGDTEDGGTGWEIDHVHPLALGGSDELTNLQPLQWQNNRAKSDLVTWECAVTRKR